MKVGIIGYGFVGKALADGLKENVDVFLVDPKLKTSIKDLQSFNPKIIFICVPTPMNNDGSQNISILYGGSVNASNAKDIFNLPNVNGGLIGGASLNSNEFLGIVKELK